MDERFVAAGTVIRTRGYGDKSFGMVAEQASRRKLVRISDTDTVLLAPLSRLEIINLNRLNGLRASVPTA